MAINPTSVINAYANANRIATGAAQSAGGGGESFSKLLQDAGTNVVDDLKKSESLSLQSVTGKTDLAAVTEAVTDAQVALQTVVAVRDRIISAYQDILKMPM
jgi:flagellar hook-basal body complex protein FliE